MASICSSSWQVFKDWFYNDPETGFALDVSRIGLGPSDVKSIQPALSRALEAMQELEAGAIANPDENRMVGHYWLRNTELAPNQEIRQAIEDNLFRIMDFATKIQEGLVRPEKAERFTDILCIGIGGSALGPQFVSSALASPSNSMRIHFFDNTDPDGIDRVLEEIGPVLHRTLTIVNSKSGGTKETRNGMLEAQNAYDRAGLRFAKHAVAVTGQGSALARIANVQQWLATFPMWDWVGGRTSELSAVGLLPAALQGIHVDELLAGAAKMDELTRKTELHDNPAALLALSWYKATAGRGSKAMVILPYCDRLALFGRYLQQLIMESLGKEKDLNGLVVNQGITVYGNKGSTDQHAYVQQLRDGVDNFFVTFIVSLKNRHITGSSMEVDDRIVTGDYLSGFWQGTRQALSESQRHSLLITVPEVSAYTIGMLIALYERTVGLYASMVNVNAYDQPGVEAGKKAAGLILALQSEVVEALRRADRPLSIEELADTCHHANDPETVFHIVQHLAANVRFGITASGTGLSASYAIDPHLA